MTVDETYRAFSRILREFYHEAYSHRELVQLLLDMRNELMALRREKQKYEMRASASGISCPYNQCAWKSESTDLTPVMHHVIAAHLSHVTEERECEHASCSKFCVFENDTILQREEHECKHPECEGVWMTPTLTKKCLYDR